MEEDICGRSETTKLRNFFGSKIKKETFWRAKNLTKKLFRSLKSIKKIFRREGHPKFKLLRDYISKWYKFRNMLKQDTSKDILEKLEKDLKNMQLNKDNYNLILHGI